VHKVDINTMGSAVGWACLQSAKLLAQAMLAEKAKIDALAPKLSATGCKISPYVSPPRLTYTCPTYDAFRACEAIYPAGEAYDESLCRVDTYAADNALARQIVVELGEKRCRAVKESNSMYE